MEGARLKLRSWSRTASAVLSSVSGGSSDEPFALGPFPFSTAVAQETVELNQLGSCWRDDTLDVNHETKRIY
jgi:hypothetical protein